MSLSPSAVLESHGFCPTCREPSTFRAENEWLRDHFFCTRCGSIPRERALIWVLDHFFPAWPTLTIHETSPVMRGASARIARECSNYIPSYFFAGLAPGTFHNGFRCENLEQLTFADASIDLHVSQDVLEHVFDPAAAFREIARTLKPGGAHVFTTPLVNRAAPSERWAALRADGAVEHLHPPEYHGNPVSEQGALVTMHWGYDITEHIAAACGLHTTIVYLDNLESGIRADYIEVLVTRKPASVSPPQGT